MAGIAYFRRADAETLYRAILEEYGKDGYETLFWDEVVNKHIAEFRLTVHPVNRDQ